MHEPYSFLKDALALVEIHKHKWLESEKIGREIGFATAALDWIKTYGQAFRKTRLGLDEAEKKFFEKRRHRRFSLQIPLRLKFHNEDIACQTHDISLMGASCTLPASLSPGPKAQATILFYEDHASIPSSRFRFDTFIRTVRSSSTRARRIFLPFSEEIQDYMRLNAGHFCS